MAGEQSYLSRGKIFPSGVDKFQKQSLQSKQDIVLKFPMNLTVALSLLLSLLTELYGLNVKRKSF